MTLPTVIKSGQSLEELSSLRDHLTDILQDVESRIVEAIAKHKEEIGRALTSNNPVAREYARRHAIDWGFRNDARAYPPDLDFEVWALDRGLFDDDPADTSEKHNGKPDHVTIGIVHNGEKPRLVAER